jgi:hypothetical protein
VSLGWTPDDRTQSGSDSSDLIIRLGGDGKRDASPEGAAFPHLVTTGRFFDAAVRDVEMAMCSLRVRPPD